jgi:hypothetical protein
MPGLAYPFVFECSSCGEETTVTRTDARDLSPDPDHRGAFELVLQTRGWTKSRDGRSAYCSDCTEERSR